MGKSYRKRYWSLRWWTDLFSTWMLFVLETDWSSQSSCFCWCNAWCVFPLHEWMKESMIPLLLHHHDSFDGWDDYVREAVLTPFQSIWPFSLFYSFEWIIESSLLLTSLSHMRDPSCDRQIITRFRETGFTPVFHGRRLSRDLVTAAVTEFVCLPLFILFTPTLLWVRM